MLVLQSIAAVFLILACAGSLYAIAAAAMVGRIRQPASQSPRPTEPVSVLKPLCGDEPGLASNLAGFTRQDYPGEVQIVAGVQDPLDPAQQAVAEVREREPGADLELVVDGRVHGSNRKVSNLINLLGHARHDVLVISDADIAVPSDYLSRVVQALAEPGVGAVTCYYYGQGRRGIWSRLAAMGISYSFLPNVTLGVATGLARPCMGSTIAIRRPTLERIGGFGRVADALTDDYAIGQALHEQGDKVALAPFFVEHACAERSLPELFAHEMRWAVTVRAIDPAGHFGTLVTHATPLALIGAVLAGGAPASLAVLALALGARFWLKARVDAAAGASSGPWLLMPARDLLSCAVFVSSHFTKAVRWKGSSFSVAADQTLSPA